MKCEYCDSESFLTNARNGLECSGCGAPVKGMSVVPSAPYYVLKINAALTSEMRERITREMEKVMGYEANRLVILDARAEYFKAVS